MLYRSFFRFSNRLYSSTAASSLALNPKEWDINVSLALFRMPLIAPPPTEIEEKFMKISSIIEHDQSYKSNFELKTEKDLLLLEKRKQLELEGKDLSQLDEQLGISNIQLLDEWKKNAEELMEKFNKNDYSALEGDFKSLKRKNDRKLVLIVRQNFEKDYTSSWILPQHKNQGETLKETAEKCIGEIVTNNISIRIFGNAPFSCYKHRYPKKVANKLGTKGEFIFCFAAQIETDLKINSSLIKDYRWSTREEVQKLLSPSRYAKNLNTIFIE